MIKIIIPVSVAFLLLFSACITGSPADHEYEYRSEQLNKVFTAEIECIFYNGYLKSHNTILEPYEYSEDGFYIIESPEMLDSIFYEINYPEIESLFPEDGVLLILSYSLIFREELAGNVFFFTDSTLKVDLTVRRWNMLTDPGIWQFVFPVGITFK